MRQISVVAILHTVLRLSWADLSSELWCETACDHDSTSYIQIHCSSPTTGIVDAKWVGNCCLNMNNTIIYGLDLRGCNLSEISATNFDWLTFDAFELLDLSSNPHLLLDKQALQRMRNLTTAVVDSDVNGTFAGRCPGGNDAWIDRMSVGDTLQCEGLVNTCYMGALNNTPNGFECPMNSVCEAYGPGLLACQCKPDYHGYKCLKYKTFSYGLFFGILIPIILFFSVCLWFTQRRHVKHD